MDIQTIKRLIGITFKSRNFYLTSQGPKTDRKDLIQRKREYIRNLIEQARSAGV